MPKIKVKSHTRAGGVKVKGYSYTRGTAKKIRTRGPGKGKTRHTFKSAGKTLKRQLMALMRHTKRKNRRR